MKTTGDEHLAGDRLIVSLADEGSLDPLEAEHLLGCPLCSAEKRRLETALEGLGRTAAALTPSPQRRFTVPSPAPSPVIQWPSRFPSGSRRPWMIGAAAAVILLLALGGILSRDNPEKQLAEIQREMLDDARLLDELSQLAESGLPEMSIALSEDFDPDDDDFLDFVVPDPTGDTTTRAPAGGTPC